MSSSAPSEQPLLYEVSDGIATITLNQPDKLNALNDQMVSECVERINEAKADDAVRVLILTGAGKGFCSGADVGKMGGEVTPVSVRARLQNGLQRIPVAMSDFDKPAIAAINGVAAGAGLDLALMCDLRFAAASAKVAETYSRLGLVPGAGGAYFLPRVVGTAKALEMLWSAEFVGAEEALRIGLVNRVFADDELMAGTRAFALKIAKAPPLSVRLIKSAVYRGLNMDVRTGLDLISSYLSIARTSNDHTEAMAAFREKRDGHYQGK